MRRAGFPVVNSDSSFEEGMIFIQLALLKSQGSYILGTSLKSRLV